MGSDRRMKIYVDTSVFSMLNAERLGAPTAEFFSLVREKQHDMVPSALVKNEIVVAPEEVKKFYYDLFGDTKHIYLTPDGEKLRDAYLAAGVVTQNSSTDAGHVALGTVLGCDAIFSWNFKHIAKPARVEQYNTINQKLGYNRIPILKPSELTSMTIAESDVQYQPRAGISGGVAARRIEADLAEEFDNFKGMTPEQKRELIEFELNLPEGVRWTRLVRRPASEKMVRMTREEYNSYWRRMHKHADNGGNIFWTLDAGPPKTFAEGIRLMEAEYQKIDNCDNPDAAWLAWDGIGSMDGKFGIRSAHTATSRL